ARRYHTAEKGVDRSWGIWERFLDQAPVVVRIEVGCWRVIVYLAEWNSAKSCLLVGNGKGGGWCARLCCFCSWFVWRFSSSVSRTRLPMAAERLIEGRWK